MVWFTFEHGYHQAVPDSRTPGLDPDIPELDKMCYLCRAPILVQVVFICVKSLARYYTRVVEC